MSDGRQWEFDCYGMTYKHPRSHHNTDRFVIADICSALCVQAADDTSSELASIVSHPRGQLLAVSHGVGDRRSAARASALAMQTVNTRLLNASGPPKCDASEKDEDDLFCTFLKAIDECRDTMQQEVDSVAGFDEMGAVVTVVYVAWPNAYIMHLGNNRAYHWCRQTVDQVTSDHTLARRLVDAGQLSQSQADRSPLRNVVWNVVGTQTQTSFPEYRKMDLGVGDAIILCSDGMAAAINELEIARALKSTDSAEQACQSLSDSAAASGFEDDATIVVARFGRL